MNQSIESALPNCCGMVEAVKSEAGKMVDGTKELIEKNKDGARPHQNPEGEVTKQIEALTTKVPSGAFLSLALGAIGLSALMQLSGKKRDAQFIGNWVPTILLLGLYNKVVKLQGSE